MRSDDCLVRKSGATEHGGQIQKADLHSYLYFFYCSYVGSATFSRVMKLNRSWTGEPLNSVP